MLQRRLQDKPQCSDLFGVKGRQWLAGLELAGRGARVRGRGSAADRVHRLRDRRGRPVDRAAGAGLAADPAVDDGVGLKPDLRRVVSRRDRRGLPVLDEPQDGGRSRSGPEGPPIRRGPRSGQAGSPSAGRRRRGGRWSKPRGAWSSNPARFLESATPPQRPLAPAQRHPPQTRRDRRDPRNCRCTSARSRDHARTRRLLLGDRHLPHRARTDTHTNHPQEAYQLTLNPLPEHFHRCGWRGGPSIPARAQQLRDLSPEQRPPTGRRARL
jgi:hypothetical protein